MERHLIETGDGSHSLYVPALDEHYHSIHGALQESRHVFLEAGLMAMASQGPTIRILEIGFGTGLNAILTAARALESGLRIDYLTVEAHPLSKEEFLALNYATRIGGPDTEALWKAMHEAPWEASIAIHPQFQLQKWHRRLEELDPVEAVDLIYFDAFAPEKQPELWTDAVFAQMFAACKAGGILVTYCAKGAVRRSMQAAGFVVERIPGPPGKREMMRARRP
jgi:tRNA U34 5-methylaminomethyl-2-thiouridine-forming methyltransferase MnmC